MKFGTHRHKPVGDWVNTSLTTSVAGVTHRLGEIRAFGEAVLRAEAAGLYYGVEVSTEPDNPYDRNAIRVLGVCSDPGPSGQSGKRSWHLGYISAPLAEELHRDLIARGVPIAAELYSIYVSTEGNLDIKIIVLAPPGHGEKARRKRTAG